MDSASQIPPTTLQRDYYFWEPPGRPVAVYLAFQVIDAINLAARQMAAAAPIHGAEIGGLLLGKSEKGQRLTVWIDRFEPVSCSYPRGASWLLTEDEQDEFAETLALYPQDQVAGFFRSHTRKDLSLSEDDAAFFTRFFAEPEKVFLLLKPFTTRPGVGGFFIWENATVHRSASCQEFPFNRRELGAGDPVIVPVPAPQERVLAGPPVMMPGTVTQEPHVTFQEEPGEPDRSSSRPWMIAAALVLAAAATGAYFWYKPRALPFRLSNERSSQAAYNAAPEPGLKLNASESEKTISLSWDREAPAIAAATRGTLAISEGTFHRSIDLTPEQLRTGRLLYSRPIAASETISFRLNIDTAQGASVSEAVEFISRERLPEAIPPPVVVRTATRPVFRPAGPPKSPTEQPLPVETISAAPPSALPPAAAPPPPGNVNAKPEPPVKILRPAPRREP